MIWILLPFSSFYLRHRNKRSYFSGMEKCTCPLAVTGRSSDRTSKDKWIFWKLFPSLLQNAAMWWCFFARHNLWTSRLSHDYYLEYMYEGSQRETQYLWMDHLEHLGHFFKNHLGCNSQKKKKFVHKNKPRLQDCPLQRVNCTHISSTS